MLSFGAPPVSGTAGAQLSLYSASEKILAVIAVSSDLSICIFILSFKSANIFKVQYYMGMIMYI